MVESFLQLLKQDRIKRKLYATREAAKMNVFNYIKMFYNSKGYYLSSNWLSSLEYERKYFNEAKLLPDTICNDVGGCCQAMAILLALCYLVKQ